MQNTNALFDELLEAYRTADDPDRFLREFLLRLEDVTSNAVVAAERKLERLDAAKARLDAAREIPRVDTSEDERDTSEDAQDTSREVDDEQQPDVDDEQQPDVGDQQEDEEQVDDPPRKRKAKRAAAGSKAPKRTRTRVH